MSRPSWDDGTNVLVPFDRIETETPAAYLIVIEEESCWIPKSQVAHLEETGLWVPLWLAEKKGLEYC